MRTEVDFGKLRHDVESSKGLREKAIHAEKRVPFVDGSSSFGELVDEAITFFLEFDEEGSDAFSEAESFPNSEEEVLSESGSSDSVFGKNGFGFEKERGTEVENVVCSEPLEDGWDEEDTELSDIHVPGPSQVRNILSKTHSVVQTEQVLLPQPSSENRVSTQDHTSWDD